MIKFNKKRGNIVLVSARVLSRKASAIALKAKQRFENLQEGHGRHRYVIKNITEYGAFVDLGGIDGLLHITDMSWGRVNHPSEVFEVGDEVTVKVLKYNADTERVSLGLKQTMEDPWNVATRRPSTRLGKKVKGKVVSLTDYGAFVELEQGVEGLIHVSEMTWAQAQASVEQAARGRPRGREPSCSTSTGSEQAHQLGPQAARARPVGPSSRSKYNPGRHHSAARVRSITDYGVFVGIEDGVDGMVHKSDLSWTQRHQQPRRPLSQGRRGRSHHPVDQSRREVR